MTVLINLILESKDGFVIGKREVNFNYIATATIVEFEGKLYVYNSARQQSFRGLRTVVFQEVDDPVTIT